MSSPELKLVPRNLTPRSFHSEASAYGLTRSGDGDNHRTCHMTMYCFLLENVVYLPEYTTSFSLHFEQSMCTYGTLGFVSL